MTPELFKIGSDWMAKATRAIKDDPWMLPIVGFEGSKHISLEWNYQDRRLNIYIGADGQATYVALVGEDIEENLEHGSAKPYDEFPRIWRWFIGDMANAARPSK